MTRTSIVIFGRSLCCLKNFNRRALPLASTEVDRRLNGQRAPLQVTSASAPCGGVEDPQRVESHAAPRRRPLALDRGREAAGRVAAGAVVVDRVARNLPRAREDGRVLVPAVGGDRHAVAVGVGRRGQRRAGVRRRRRGGRRRRLRRAADAVALLAHLDHAVGGVEAAEVVAQVGDLERRDVEPAADVDVLEVTLVDRVGGLRAGVSGREDEHRHPHVAAVDVACRGCTRAGRPACSAAAHRPPPGR